MTDAETVNKMVEIIWTAEQEETGVFGAMVGRKQAQALVKEGYTINAGKVPANANDIFGILVQVEDEVTGTFRAVVARKVSQALVANGATAAK